MNEIAAYISPNWEFHLVNGQLLLTARKDPDKRQIVLDVQDTVALLAYLSQHTNELSQWTQQPTTPSDGISTQEQG